MGKVFRIHETYSKFYPTCRHAQPAIEAVIDMVKEHSLQKENIKNITVGTHEVAYSLTGIIKHPKTTAEAKFSIPYGIALAFEEHTVSVKHLYENYRENKTLNEIANLVTVSVSPSVQALYPQKRGACVTIHLKDGKSFTKELYDLKGSKNNPISWDDLVLKFKSNATAVMPKETAEKIVDMSLHFDTLPTISNFYELLHYNS